jgi:hypothetical protein
MDEILERPKAPTRRRLDTEVYYKMARGRHSNRPGHVEPIDGEIIDMTAIGSHKPQSRTGSPDSLPARCMTTPRWSM